MRHAALIDWTTGQDMVFHLRRALELSRGESQPLLDPSYDAQVDRISTEEERHQQVRRLRRHLRWD